MDLIEVSLNSYRYHFRRLSWFEEIRLPFAPNEDQRKTIVSHALADVSGLKVTVAQALDILKRLPDAIFWKIWILYRRNLPEEQNHSPRVSVVIGKATVRMSPGARPSRRTPSHARHAPEASPPSLGYAPVVRRRCQEPVAV
jgi:hypothetical protein